MKDQDKTREELEQEVTALHQSLAELKAYCEEKTLEFHQLSETLMQEQHLMSVLMDNIPDHVYYKDLESRFFRNNKAHVLSFGMNDSQQLAGKSDFDFFVKDIAQKQYEDEQEIIRTGKPMHKEEFTIRSDHSVNWYQTTKMPLYNKAGSISGTFGISRDITRRKMAEEELKRKNEELTISNSIKDKFFSVLAHDLRSPFQGFLGLLELISEELPSLSQEEIRDKILWMRVTATNIFQLLEDLLEWSKMQRGISNFEPVTLFILSTAIKSLVPVLEKAKEKGIEIIYQIPGDLAAFADVNMLNGILRNLVTNALKFTRRGGKIVISAKSVKEGQVEISVKDTGIGMDAKMVQNLFRLDVNNRRKGTEDEPSSGLGLIICKDFIELNGGKFWVESEVGAGSTFYFTLPQQPEKN